MKSLPNLMGRDVVTFTHSHMSGTYCRVKQSRGIKTAISRFVGRVIIQSQRKKTLLSISHYTCLLRAVSSALRGKTIMVRQFTVIIQTGIQKGFELS